MPGHRDTPAGQPHWLLPVLVSFPLALQTIDTTIMGPALPAMAASLRVEPLQLNLAVTSYLISLAIFLPASGWLSDRFGARRMFCCAIALFSISSGLCALANSLEMLVVCRILQGMGGSIMIPTGRIILLRTVSPAAMVGAMVWFTMIPAVARLVGPLVSGLAVTWLSWRWIFLSNLPLGLLAIGLAMSFIKPSPAASPSPKFDVRGFLLLATSLVTLLAAVEGATSRVVDGGVSLTLVAVGLTSAALYAFTSLRSPNPIIDLGVLRYRTYFASVVGGMPLRLAIGAVPFMLPLLFQLGFGMSPIQSGLLTVSSAIGSFTTRATITRALRRVGFRTLMIAATVCCSLAYFAYGQFRATTPQIAIVCALIVGGLAMSMAIVSLQTLGFSEIPEPLIGNATVLATMVQQITISFGVMAASELLQLAAYLRGGSAAQLHDFDFHLAFTCIGAIVPLSCVFFLRLPSDAGSDMRGPR
jgi:EmrB/QacA subfamily drug resistance transporter